MTMATGSDGALILLYHRVARPESDIHGLAVPPEDFRAQMTYLRDYCTPMPLDALARVAPRGTFPPRAVAVTFDDGYVDNYAAASPILSEVGVPATFFLTTERLNEADYEYWWDRLERCLLSDDAASDLQLDLPTGRSNLPTRTPPERVAAYWSVYWSIVGAARDERDRAIDAVTTWAGKAGSTCSANRRMTPQEIRSLAARAGHAIGAHSVHHLKLPHHPVAVQREEIRESRRSLERLIERPVTTFAYPNGAFNDDTIREVRAAAFDAAVTTEGATIQPGVDPLRLSRVEVAHRDRADFGAWIDSRFTPQADH
jgi:peptidoglycan/xylan/chitin deacetylase (PgdA/CDA1 family)